MNAEAPASVNPWETNASFWVTIIREHRDRYRTELTDPAVLRAIGPAAGLRVLDAGCAEGYMSRTLAQAGADVTGIDLSTRLIDAARDKNVVDHLPIKFDVGSVNQLPYDNDTFDLIVCNHVMNDLEDPAESIKEFSRVLIGGGRLIMLMLHPCFYNKHVERTDRSNESIAASYFELRDVEQHFVVDGLTSPVANKAWFRPLEFYITQLCEANFVITGLGEPHPTKEQIQVDPWWRAAFSRPLFLLVTAELAYRSQ